MIAIPTTEQCLGCMRDMNMLAHIRDHSLQVCRVALVISDGLIAKGLRINRNLVAAAALLHDITKTRSFDTGENHARSGAALVTLWGYPQVGRIVGQHVRLEGYFMASLPGEAEIVNYADKRVMHDRIVGLERRMTYILDQYGGTPEKIRGIRWLWGMTRRVETRLFGYLDFPPAAVAARVGQRRRPGGRDDRLQAGRTGRGAARAAAPLLRRTV